MEYPQEYFFDLGPYECNELGINASFNSVASCLVFKLPFKLEDVYFGYICIGLLVPIIVISLFGRIKEQYRWFILNQAIWDLLVSYNFICNKPTHSWWFSGFDDTSINQGAPNCFYGDIGDYPDSIFYGTLFFTIRNISYLSLFLLTLSRFLALYCQNFYEKHKSSRKLIISIIFGNILFFILVSLRSGLGKIIGEDQIRVENQESYRLCFVNSCNYTVDPVYCDEAASTACIANLTPYNFLWLDIFQWLKEILPSVLLVLSIIFSISVISKILTQLKFQAKHHRSKLSTSLRISLICLFQCLTIVFIFSLSLLHDIYTICSTTIDIPLCETYLSWHTMLPQWLYYSVHLHMIQSFNILRIFIDSCLVMLVINGYRQHLIAGVKVTILIFTKPKKLWRGFKDGSCTSQNTVTILNKSSKSW